MCRLRPVPKQIKKLSEEAASHFVGRLLSLRKKQKLSSLKFCKQLGISPETLYRWGKTLSIPSKTAVEICAQLKIQEPPDLFGVSLSGPADFIRALGRPAEWAHIETLRIARQVVGYAAVWLSGQLVDRALELVVQPRMGPDDMPASQVFVNDLQGNALAHVQFVAKGGMMFYQVFSHRAGLLANLEFEGVAEQLGFDFCLEYLEQLTTHRGVQAVRIQTKIDKEINRHYERQFKSGGKARSGISTAPSGSGDGETL